MKKLNLFSIVLVCCAWFSTALGQDNQPNLIGGLKMGFVNTLEVLYGTEEGKREIGKVEQFMADKQKEFETKNSELEKLKEQFAAQQRTLNPETRTEMQRAMEEQDRQMKRFQEDTQLEINRRRDELLGRMAMKIQKIIDAYAEQNKYAVVFLRDESQPYVAPSLDITQEIIRIYNQQNPVAPPAPAPQPPVQPASKPPGE